MAKGYNPNKAREKQQARADNVAESNFGENVLENLTREFEIPKADNSQILSIPIRKLYAAPSNKDWDSFQKLSPDEEYNLQQTIIDGGLLQPVVLWKVNRNDVLEEYINDFPKYDFSGSEYMILSGHSRTNAFIKIYEQTGDKVYENISAIVKTDIDKRQAQYIVKVTNYGRTLTSKDKREQIVFLHRTLDSNKTKGMNIAQKIANDTGAALRTVKYQLAINEKIIPDIIKLLDDGVLSQANVIKLLGLNKSLQDYMVKNYKDRLTNDTMKNFKKYFDRKELIDTIFINEDIEYTDVVTQVPTNLEKKFREMTRKWINKNI